MFTIARSARAVVLSAFVLGGGLLLAGSASAHVTLTPGEGHAGEYVVGTIAVPHGCEGSATTKITIKVPEQLLSVTPTLNPLWVVEKRFVKLAKPLEDAYGNQVTKRVDQIVYTAKTPLEDGYRDAFDLSFQVPDAAGTTIYFPTIQTCVKGQTAWVEIAEQGAEEPEHPAPAYRVLPAVAESKSETVADTKPVTERTDAGEGNESSDDLAITGLAVGAIGLSLGGAALARTRRRS